MKPNILWLIADQYRGDCLSCAGHPDVKTPTYDALAAAGTRFEKAYTPNPICVPARATMITGNKSHKCTGLKSNGGKIKDDQIKLPALLAENGYKTYSSGKLHYAPYSAPGEERLLHGFQNAALAESGRILKQFDPKGELEGLEDYFDYLKKVGWQGYSRAHGVGNNDIHPAASPLPAEHNVDSWVATQAIDYLEQHQKQSPDQPFFLNVGFPKPHSPYDPPRPYDAMHDPRKISRPASIKDGQPRSPHSEKIKTAHGFDFLSPEAVQVARAHYFGLIHFQDLQAGRIIQYLKDHDLYKNTIIVFTADHGDMLGDFGYFFKTSMYEGSARIPLIIAWPETLKNNQVTDALAGLEDLVPTMLDLIEIDLPGPVDGKSLAPALKGEAFDERDYYVSYSLPTPQQTCMITDKRYKYIHNEIGGLEELYDLVEDPAEEHNIAASPAQTKRVEKMRNQLIEWARENGDEMLLDSGTLACSDSETFSETTFSHNAMGWRWY